MKKIKVLRFYLYDFIRENAFFVAPYIQEKGVLKIRTIAVADCYNKLL